MPDLLRQAHILERDFAENLILSNSPQNPFLKYELASANQA
jgi:hypothetical protein